MGVSSVGIFSDKVGMINKNALLANEKGGLEKGEPNAKCIANGYFAL